jgi:hypothetical protein
MKANVGHSPELETSDSVSGVKYLVREGIADTKRLGIMGWSAGGEETAWAISESGLREAHFEEGNEYTKFDDHSVETLKLGVSTPKLREEELKAL